MFFSAMSWIKAKFLAIVDWFKSKFTKPVKSSYDGLSVQDDVNNDLTDVTKICISTIKKDLQCDPQIKCGAPYADRFNTGMLNRHFDLLENSALKNEEPQNIVNHHLAILFNIFNREQAGKSKLYQDNSKILASYLYNKANKCISS